jgi:hypothetical protein|tara:strand:+ start:213 stop:776 length:564 start_codon:yes stop_codon:yes gene_type:complete
MACGLLTKGRGLDCNRISGGIKYVYFAVYDQVTSIPQTAGEITDIEMGSNVLYRYTMPLGVASLTDTIVGSRENGTIYYTPNLNVILNKLTKEDQNQVKLLGATKTIIFAQLNEQLTNGHDVIVGLGTENGMGLNAGTMDSGAAWGDRNGYTLTFDGMEALPFPMVADYTTDPFDNAAFTMGTIVTS